MESAVTLYFQRCLFVSESVFCHFGSIQGQVQGLPKWHYIGLITDIYLWGTQHLPSSEFGAVTSLRLYVTQITIYVTYSSQLSTMCDVIQLAFYPTSLQLIQIASYITSHIHKVVQNDTVIASYKIWNKLVTQLAYIPNKVVKTDIVIASFETSLVLCVRDHSCISHARNGSGNQSK